MIISVVLGVVFVFYLIVEKNKQLEYMKQTVNKFTDFYHLMNRWVEVKNAGRSVTEYFEEQGYYNIAVYGMADMANRLYEDLEGTRVKIVYGIDRDVCCTGSKVENIYSLQDEFPKVDVIVVTPFYAYDSIKDNLEKKVKCAIISIEEVIWSM